MRFLAVGLILCVACSDSDDDDGTPTPDVGSPTQGPAYLVVQRIQTPAQRTVILTALPDLEQRTLDPADGLELSGFSRAFAFDGKVFVFDGESGQVTRYAVSADLEFVSEATFSMAGEGIVQFRSLFAFLNEDRAYYFDVPGQQVVVFSPSDMSITSTFDVPEVNRDGFNTGGGTLVRVGDEVIAPINWTNSAQGRLVPNVAAFVFSATDDRFLRRIEDPRCAVVGASFLDGDQYYLMGDSSSGSFDIFTPLDLPPPCLIRGSEGQDALDPDFLINLREVTEVPHISAAVGRGDGTVVLRMFDPSIDPADLTDPQAYFMLELWRYGLLNLTTNEVQLVEALPRTGISFDPAVIDGSYYVQQLDEAESRTTLYRLDDQAQAFESINLSGDLLSLERIR